jgi:hypothetical protein
VISPCKNNHCRYMRIMRIKQCVVIFSNYICREHYYGRRKGQKLAFKTKQTYNVISVNKKTPNKRHYLLNQWTFFRNKYTWNLNQWSSTQPTYVFASLHNKRLSLHNKRLSLHNERLSCKTNNAWYLTNDTACTTNGVSL